MRTHELVPATANHLGINDCQEPMHVCHTHRPDLSDYGYRFDEELQSMRDKLEEAKQALSDAADRLLHYQIENARLRGGAAK